MQGSESEEEKDDCGQSRTPRDSHEAWDGVLVRKAGREGEGRGRGEEGEGGGDEEGEEEDERDHRSRGRGEGVMGEPRS